MWINCLWIKTPTYGARFDCSKLHFRTVFPRWLSNVTALRLFIIIQPPPPFLWCHISTFYWSISLEFTTRQMGLVTALIIWIISVGLTLLYQQSQLWMNKRTARCDISTFRWWVCWIKTTINSCWPTLMAVWRMATLHKTDGYVGHLSDSSIGRFINWRGQAVDLACDGLQTAATSFNGLKFVPGQPS